MFTQLNDSLKIIIEQSSAQHVEIATNLLKILHTFSRSKTIQFYLKENYFHRDELDIGIIISQYFKKLDSHPIIQCYMMKIASNICNVQVVPSIKKFMDQDGLVRDIIELVGRSSLIFCIETCVKSIICFSSCCNFKEEYMEDLFVQLVYRLYSISPPKTKNKQSDFHEKLKQHILEMIRYILKMKG